MLEILLTIAGVHWLAVMSPGPDVFFVTQTAISRSRTEALSASVGIVLGVAFWAALSLLGLHILFERFAWLQSGVMILGGLYLLWMAYALIRSSFKAADPAVCVELKSSCGKAFLFGFLTNLSNPKVLIYFASVFSLFVTPQMGPEDKLAIFLLICIESFLWFALIATLFGLPAFQNTYRRSGKWIDRASGGIFGTFGAALIFSGLSSR